LTDRIKLLTDETEGKRKEAQEVKGRIETKRREQDEINRTSNRSRLLGLGAGLLVLSGLLYHRAKIKSLVSASPLLNGSKIWNYVISNK
jgi:hypothetical protein